MPSDEDPSAWLRVPRAPERRGPSTHDPSAWHYTNAAGLAGIVSSGVLWAYSTRGMNDTQEVNFGVAAFHRLWDRVKPTLASAAPSAAFETWLTDIEQRALAREVMAVCACEDGDSLLHWQAYAQIDDGYAIELSPTVEFKVLAPPDTPELFQPDDVPAIFWRPVTYGDKDPDWDWDYWDPTRRMIDEGLTAFFALQEGRVKDEAVLRDVLDRQHVALVYAYKHQGFADEREKRLIAVRPPIDGYVTPHTTRYGPSSKASLAAVPESDFERYSTDRISPLPIISVRLAPRNPEGDEERVRALLDSAGYRDVPVTRSSTPIR